MPDARIVINDEEIRKFGFSRGGPLARELRFQADRVVAKTKENLNSKPGTPRAKTGRGTKGYPHKVTGRLRQSVQRTPVQVGPNGIYIYIFADAVSRRGETAGQPYGPVLLGRKYVFITGKDLRSLGE